MLYNTFRPVRFRDVAGQDAAKAILKSQVKKGHVGHAYLFAGPSGCGKTTIARVLAAALFCGNMRAGDACGRCVDCVNVQKGGHWDFYEQDAASENGVDAVRDLVGRAYLAPISGRKVYLLDEAHMLTEAASNALLKTLEDAPSHLVWMLCTTRPDRLLDTVRSRCQGFRLSKLTTGELVEVLDKAARSARHQVDRNGLKFIAEQSEGNARLALTVLEQVMAANGKKVTTRQAKRVAQGVML